MFVIMSSSQNGDFQTTITAPEKVLGARSAPNRDQRCSLFEVDPTTGALKVRPEHRLKIEKALRAEAKRIYQRLLLRRLRLQVEYFALQSRLALLVLFRNLRSVFAKL